MSKSKPPTDAELKAMEARCNAASYGPWRVWYCENISVCQEGDGDPLIADFGDERSEMGPDAEFVAHAREDLPRCLAEIKRLKRKLKKLEPSHLTRGEG